MQLRFLLSTAAVMLAACGQTGSPIATGPASTLVAPTQLATTPPIPTAALPSRVPTTPPGVGRLDKGEPILLAWKSSTYVYYVVVVPLKNAGTGWAEALAFNSDYTILDANGGITETGSFTYAYPALIAPGETGYLVEESLDDGVKVGDFAKVEVEAQYREADDPGATFKVEDIRWKRQSYSDGLTASGFITSSADFQSAAVAVFCWGADGSLLGVSTTNLVQNVTAGKRKAFETVQETGPLRASDCKKSTGYVSGQDY